MWEWFLLCTGRREEHKQKYQRFMEEKAAKQVWVQEDLYIHK